MPTQKITFDAKRYEPTNGITFQDYVPLNSGTGDSAPPPLHVHLQRAFDEAATPPALGTHPGVGGAIRDVADDLGAGIVGLASPLVHPVKFAQSLRPANPWEVLGGPGAVAVDRLVKPFLPKGGEDIGAYARRAGGQAIAAIPSLVLSGHGGAAEDAAEGIGSTTERAGINLGNASLGARGPKPFKYGADPARGAFEEGVLPALSKHGAALKLEKAIPRAGQRVSDAVMKGGNVPLGDIARSIESPVNEARGIIEGPGGGSRSVEPIEALRVSMARRAPGASAPVYGPGAGTRFTAGEAAAHLGREPKLMLPPPMEDIPLHISGDAQGRLSEPISLFAPEKRVPRMLAAPRNVREEIPLQETPGHEPSVRPMAFNAEKFPQRNIVGGVGPRSARELGSTAATIPSRLTREAFMSGSEHHELSGQIPESAGILRRFEPESQGFTAGMGPNEYIGEIPGERGGPGEIQGVLRRRASYPESKASSGLGDLRHAHASASDLWRTIQNLDKNTRFNPDPEVEGVNELRRDIRGGLRGNLEEATPGLKPISRRYGDLKAAEEALERTMHTTSGISKLVKVPMFPVESSLGSAMFHGGKAIQSAAPMARVIVHAAPVGPLIHGKKRESQ